MQNLGMFVNKIYAEKNWRITCAVRNVIKILEKNPIPLSVQEIADSFNAEDKAVDITTIYRILDRLEKIGLVHDLRGKFIACSDPENKKEAHHFLQCKKCGRAEEIFLDYKQSISAQLAKEKNFILEDIELLFFGICDSCAKK